jgi:GNAT superfamily N-acetyltransferase
MNDLKFDRDNLSERIATKMPGLFLKFATENDTPLILDFIKQLAAYEKMVNEVTANIDTLRLSLFGHHKVAEVILAEYKELPVAFTLFFHNFSTFLGKPGLYIEDLFVKPEMRGKGIGTTMLCFLARLALDRNCGRMEWWVLDWNSSAIRFYEKIGAQAMDEWTVFRVTEDRLTHLAEKI